MGDQLTGRSTAHAYRRQLLQQCRHLEIDCWDGKREPLVTHGHTFVTAETFDRVAQAVAECAFITSDLPVLLSLEMHCSSKQQHRLATMAVEHIGDNLLKYDDLVATGRGNAISPVDLSRSVLLKGKVKGIVNDANPASNTDSKVKRASTHFWNCASSGGILAYLERKSSTEMSARDNLRRKVSRLQELQREQPSFRGRSGSQQDEPSFRSRSGSQRVELSLRSRSASIYNSVSFRSRENESSLRSRDGESSFRSGSILTIGTLGNLADEATVTLLRLERAAASVPSTSHLHTILT